MVFVFQFSAFAQEKTVTGTVTESGLPLPGATVQVKGTNKITETDFNGKYSISAKPGEVLEFIFVGLKAQPIVVGASSVYNVVMVTDVGQLTEVVLVTEGYDRTRTRANTVTASTTISSETIENRPNVSVLTSLQGTTPGASITSSSGSPGSGKIDVLIRGVSSLSGSNDPLVVIDGIPSTGNQFRNLNQNDIEQVTILKDAAGTAIYGNKGANGVIQITTKKARYGSGFKINYDGVTGLNTLPDNNYNMADAKQLLKIEQNRGIGVGGSMTDAEIAGWSGPNTNWRDVFFRTDITQQHNLGIQIGGENFSSYTSLGYYEQGGMVPTTDFKRISLRNNMQAKSRNDRFHFDSQINLAYSKRHELDQENNSGINNNTIQNPLHGYLFGIPYMPESPYTTGQDLYNAIGTNFNGANDTYVLQDIIRSKYNLPSWATEASALINLGVSYKITDQLTVRNRSGLDVKQNDRLFARAPWAYLSIAVRESRGEQYGGSETLSGSKFFTFTNISSLNYSNVFNEVHDLSVGAFFEYTKEHYSAYGRFQNGLNPLNYSPGAGTGYVPFNPSTPNSYISTVSAGKLDGGTLSAFLTLDYDYKEKYGFSGVLRRDGTYRFVNDNRWGTFWSVAGRWNIDKEAFLENSSFFDMLKLRASYGVMGNQTIIAPGYGTPSLLTGYNLVRDLNATATGYENQVGVGLGQIGNPDLRWEEISQANIGLDFRILNKRLEGNIDVYQKTTSNLFYSNFVSGVNGIYEFRTNNGELENKGVELALRYHIVRNENLKLSVFANGSHNTTKITELIETDQTGVDQLIQTGYLYGEWNLVPYVGVNQATGNLLFLDRDGNVTETPDNVADRRPSGKSHLPRYQGGFGFDVDYKGFFLNTLFSYAMDVWRYDIQFYWANDPSFISNDNVSADLLNAWTPTNTNTNIPSLTASNLTVYDDDRFLYDSSYLRLKNITLGYNFPSKFLERSGIASLRFFVQGENLFTWTKWRGFDPESISSSQNTGYPTPRTISFGASIGL